jgi:ADP-ribose pyrophosphatase
VAKRAQAEVLSSETVYEGPVFGVRQDRVREPGGVEATRDVVTHPGSVVVLPVFPDQRIVIIRQYRHSARQFMWELVAGRKDPGETYMHAAHRELHEETGYVAGRMRRILDVFPTPGFVEERMLIFVAEKLKAGPSHPEEDERITIRILPLLEALAWIRDGKVHDAKSVAGILFYANFLAKTDWRAKKR